MKLTMLLITMLGILMVTGCGSDAGNGALLGTAAGAGIGALAGGDTEATLIGAAVGGGAGYILGNESDKNKTKKETAQQMDALRYEQNIVTVWVTNSNGSKIPVRLTKSGPNFVGPKGEIYGDMPTEEQLRMVYGF